MQDRDQVAHGDSPAPFGALLGIAPGRVPA